MQKSVIALYIRLSMEDEKYDSLSIPNQRLLLREKALSLTEYEDAEILEFVDNGYSGTNFERPAMQELLGLVQGGKIDCIIVKDLSRFGRESLDTGYFMQMVFPLYHTRFIAVSDNYDSNEYKGDTGGVDVTFKYLINEFYCKDLSKKIRTVKLAKRKRGEWQSANCPYGYQKGADGRLEPDEITAPTVKCIFEWAASGCSAEEITRKLYELQIPTPAEYKASMGKKYHDISRTNGVWCSSTVLRILADERYIGTYISGKWESESVGSNRTKPTDESEWIKIPDHHTPIISKELFEAAKSSIRRYSLPNRKKRDYLLRGKVYCGYCGHAMSRSNNKYGAISFHCRYSDTAKNADCAGLKVMSEDLEKAVYDIIRVQAEMVMGNSSDISEITCSTDSESEYEKKLSELKNSRRQLYEEFVEGNINKKDYTATKSQIDEQLSEANRIYAAIVDQKRKAEEKYRTEIERREILAEISSFDGLTNELVERLIKRVYVFHDNRIEIEYAVKDIFE